MIYHHNKFHKLGPNDTLVIAIRTKVKENFFHRQSVILRFDKKNCHDENL
jgi:hypothetical protein